MSIESTIEHHSQIPDAYSLTTDEINFLKMDIESKDDLRFNVIHYLRSILRYQEARDGIHNDSALDAISRDKDKIPAQILDNLHYYIFGKNYKEASTYELSDVEEQRIIAYIDRLDVVRPQVKANQNSTQSSVSQTLSNA